MAYSILLNIMQNSTLKVYKYLIRLYQLHWILHY